MIIQDAPQSGRLGLTVTYPSRTGLVRRSFVTPANPRSSAQMLIRSNLATQAAAYDQLTDGSQPQCFDITWGGHDGCGPPVWVQILGPTRELLVLRMEDTRYSRRPPIVFTHGLALCGLPQPRLPPGQLDQRPQTLAQPTLPLAPSRPSGFRKEIIKGLMRLSYFQQALVS